MFPLLIPGILAAGRKLFGPKGQQQPMPQPGTQLGFPGMTPNVQMTPGNPPMQDLLPAPTSFPMPPGPEMRRRGLLRGIDSLGRQNMMQAGMMAAQGNWGTPLGMILGAALKKTPGGF